MLMEVKNNFKFLILSLKYNLKSSMEYKKSFIIQTVFMFINNGFFIIFWNLVFNINNGDVNGLVMNDILLMWSLATISWGLSNFLFGGLRELNRYILTGTLDTYLLQPKNIILSIATSKSDFSACGDLLYGLVVGLFACNSVKMYMLMLLYSFIGTIVTCSTFILIRTLSIWIGEVEQIAHVYENSLFITFCIYPFEIFGGFIKFMMFTVVPAAYVSYFPVKLLGKFDIKKFIILLIATAIIFIISNIFFYLSMKRYESGNNIAMKE